MLEEGVVVAVEAGEATVKLSQKDECLKCGLCAIDTDRSMILRGIANLIGAEVGDRVRIETGSWQVTRSALILYGLPILALFAGFGLGAAVGGKNWEPLGALFGIILMGVVYAGVAWYHRASGPRPTGLRVVEILTYGALESQRHESPEGTEP